MYLARVEVATFLVPLSLLLFSLTLGFPLFRVKGSIITLSFFFLDLFVGFGAPARFGPRAVRGRRGHFDQLGRCVRVRNGVDGLRLPVLFLTVEASRCDRDVVGHLPIAGDRARVGSDAVGRALWDRCLRWVRADLCWAGGGVSSALDLGDIHKKGGPTKDRLMNASRSSVGLEACSEPQQDFV